MHKFAIAIAAGGAFGLLAGCGVPSTPEPTPTEGPVPPVVSASPVPTDPASPTATPTPDASEATVGRRPASIDNVRVTGTLYPVRRSGKTATLNLLVESQDPSQGFMLFNALGDGNPETSAKDEFSVDGVRLVDNTAKKAYLAAVTVDGHCLCTPTGSAATMSSTSLWVTVVFAAPPASLTAVDVVVPLFGTFTQVNLV